MAKRNSIGLIGMLSLKQEFGKSHGHRPHPPSVDKEETV